MPWQDLLISRLIIYAVGCSIGGMDLVTHVSGEYTKRLVVSGASVRIKLFRPPGTLPSMF